MPSSPAPLAHRCAATGLDRLSAQAPGCQAGMKGCTPTRVREAHKTALTQAMEVPHRVILSVWDQPRVGFAGGIVWRERLSGEAASGDGLTAVTAMCRPMTGAKTSRAGGRPSARCCGRRLERPRARAGTGGEQVQERHGSRRFRPAVAGCSRVSRSSDQALWSALRLMRVLLRASQPEPMRSLELRCRPSDRPSNNVAAETHWWYPAPAAR